MKLERLEELRTNGGHEPPWYELIAEIDRLRATVEKLPIYADTGDRFVPNRAPCWVVFQGEVAPVVMVYWNYGTGRWAFDVQDGEYEKVATVYGPAYSAREAAREAMEENDDAP